MLFSSAEQIFCILLGNGIDVLILCQWCIATNNCECNSINVEYGNVKKQNYSNIVCTESGS